MCTEKNNISIKTEFNWRQSVKSPATTTNYVFLVMILLDLEKISSMQLSSWSKCPIFMKRRCIFLFLVFLTVSGGKYTSATSHHPSSQDFSSFNLIRTRVIAKVSCIFIYLLEKNRKKERSSYLVGIQYIATGWRIGN